MKKLTYSITEVLFDKDNANYQPSETHEAKLNVFYEDEQLPNGKALIHHASYDNPLKTFNSREDELKFKKGLIYPAHWLIEQLDQVWTKAADDEKHLLQDMMKEMENDNRGIRWAKEAIGVSDIMDFEYNEERGVVEYHDNKLCQDPIGIHAEIDIDEFSITLDKYSYNGIDELGDYRGTYDIGIEDDEWEDSHYWDIWNDEHHTKASEIQIKLCIL